MRRNILYILFFINTTLSHAQDVLPTAITDNDSVTTENKVDTIAVPQDSIIDVTGAFNEEELQRQSKLDSLAAIYSPIYNIENVILQGRYLAKGGDFPKSFAKRLSLGLISGYQTISPRGVNEVTGSVPLGAYVKYDFSRLHSVRLSGIYNAFGVKGYGNDISQMEGDVDYMFNLSNYFNGYRHERRFNASLVLGGGYIFSEFCGEKLQTAKAQMGLNASFRITSNASLFVEPYVAIASDEIDYSKDYNAHKWDLLYGARAGIAISLNKVGNSGAEDDYNGNLFFEMSQSLNAYPTDVVDFTGSVGTTYTLSMGKWIDRLVGLKLSGTFGDFIWSEDHTQEVHYMDYVLVPSFTRRYRSGIMSGRLEFMFDLMSAFTKTKQKNRVFDLNLNLGGEYGYLWRELPIDALKNELRTYYTGFTGSMQFLVKPDANSAIFLEPRFTWARYSIPYTNTTAYKKNYNDKIYSLAVGMRMQLPKKADRTTIKEASADFEQHLYAGIHMGGTKKFRASYISIGGMPNITVGADARYDLHPLASFTFKADYMSTKGTSQSIYKVDDGTTYYTPAMWVNTSHVLNTELAYMLNLSNVYQGWDSNRRLNAYLELGPTFSYVMGCSHSLADGVMVGGKNPKKLGSDNSGCNSLGMFGALVADYRVSDNITLFAESSAQLFAKQDFKKTTKFFNKDNLITKFRIGCWYRIW